MMRLTREKPVVPACVDTPPFLHLADLLNFFADRELPHPALAWLPPRGARVVALVATLVGLLGIASCRNDSDPLVIGIAGPFGQVRGHSMLIAARLAVKEINDAGGINGRRLQLDSLDDSASTRRAIAVAEQLRDDPRVVAVIGHLTSATTIAAAGIYKSGNHPVVAISPSASAPDLSGISTYMFRVCATDLVHGAYLARFAIQQLGARTASVIYLNDDYGRGILGTFSDEFARLGGRVQSSDPMLPNTGDIDPYLERIQREANSQVIMVAGDRAAATTVLRKARARGLNLPIIGGDALTGIQDEGALAEGVHLTSNYLPELPGDANARFLEAYRAVSGGELPDHRGAGAYDAVHLIADAIRDAGPRRAAIRDALSRLGRGRPAYDGVTGRITFDDNGDVPNKTVYVGVVRGGRLTLAAGQGR